MIPKFVSNTKKQLVLFDMDGVCAEFIAGEEIDIRKGVFGAYANKRPIKSIISVAKELSNMQNITVGILSSCNWDNQVGEKKDWLKIHMPFIKDENIHIIVWNNEAYTKETKCYAKLDFMKTINGFDDIFLIEDTHKNISSVNDEMPNAAHHVSELID